MSSSSVDALVGRVIGGKFAVEELIGSGAMGRVYRANHRDLARTVAIKVMQLRPDGPGTYSARFRAEARAASRLDHPHSVRILDFGEEEKDGFLYIVMEHVDGANLQTVLSRDGPMHATRIAFIMIQVLSALRAAHAAGVIHRDVKPGNILLTERSAGDGPSGDYVKVCDFGLAKILSVERESRLVLTAAGAVFGTPAYMSPEQALGEALDPRSDLYACGVLMFKMATGRTPFRAATATGVLKKHVVATPPTMHALGFHVDPELERIVSKCLQKARDKRYPDAETLEQALLDFLEERLAPVPQWAALPTLRARPASAMSALPGSDPAPVSPVPPVTTASLNPLEEDDSAGQTAIEASPPSTIPTPGSASWTFVPGLLAIVLASAVLGWLIYRGEPVAVVEHPIESALTQRADEPSPEAPENAVSETPADALREATEDPLLSETLGRLENPEEAGLPAEPDPMPETPTEAGLPIESDPMPETPTVDVEPTAPAARMSGRTRRPKTERIASNSPGTPSPDGRDSGFTAMVAARAAPAAESIPVPLEAEPAPAPGLQPVERPFRPPERQPRRSDIPRPRPYELPENFELSLEVSQVRVGGGASRMGSKHAIERHVEAMQSCLRPLVEKLGFATAARIDVRAELNERGRLTEVRARGLRGTTSCMQDALRHARLPPPDTGQTEVRFSVRYRTVVPR